MWKGQNFYTCLLSSSIAIFVFILVVEQIFFMNNKKTGHYRAIMSGFCCFDCYNAKKNKYSPSRIITNILLPLLNQVLTYIYGFFCQTFVDYWRIPLSPKVENVDRDSEYQKCSRCKQHNAQDYHKTKDRICVFCDSKWQENGQKTLLGDGKVDNVERKLLAEIESHGLCVTAISKLVTASSENSFMPLLQTAILFPRYFHQLDMFYLMQKKDCQVKTKLKTLSVSKMISTTKRPETNFDKISNSFYETYVGLTSMLQEFKRFNA